MTGADGTGHDREDTGPRLHADTSDARLTELLRGHTTTAYPALQELRARHLPRVLAYARLCAPDDALARQLAAGAVTSAARRVARGLDPGLPWRHHLLLLTARTAGTWATDERAAGLDPALLLLLRTTGPDGPLPPMLTAFQTLPDRAQGLVWYGIVEGEPPERTAALLGLTREDVAYGTGPALQQLARACLHTRLAASDDPDCLDFGRLIEESVRPENPRDSADLQAHRAHCPHCAAAHAELAALRDTPRAALAEGLLPWGGTAYTGAVARGGTVSGRGTRVRPGRARETRPDRRQVVLVSAALGVALLPLVLFLVAQAGPDGGDPAGAAVSVPPPAVTSAAATGPTTSSTSSPAPSPSPSRTSKSPSPSPSSSPPKSSRPKPSPSKPAARPPSSSFAQVVNAGSGLCLDVGGAFFDGTDVITARCSGSRTQRWRVDEDRDVLQSAADPDFCLDSRGDTDRGVGIWDCDSVGGRNGRNLRFVVDGDGLIRPVIASGTALTPDGGVGDGLSLEPVGTGPRQRWRAGAA
ncbi:RICIN domain-containing protein [Streptomyces sp. KAU_LT]|uniref:RICIN domain-containing protein n=1 Tax=Streptomyces sp. KAU_LT TaxID=3046669 RepID=UPI0024B6C8B3|nr:RICIN domain-containing protein [Streptomyces sp. KAU_LT]MDI9829639.1 RICIN domain-containing protein [Streptomyces sp. KAU_LT]